MKDLLQRIEELEIKMAFQDDLIDALQQHHLELENILQLQQEQLRYIYQQLQQQKINKPNSLIDEKPPHY